MNCPPHPNAGHSGSILTANDASHWHPKRPKTRECHRNGSANNYSSVTEVSEFAFCRALVQLGLLGFGLTQNGDVGVGISPQGEEVLICGAGFVLIARERLSTPQLQMRKCCNGLIQSNARVIEYLLEFRDRRGPIVRGQVRLSTNVNGIKVK